MKIRRKHSAEFKARLVLDLLSGRRSVTEIVRKEQIKDSQLYQWRDHFIENAPSVFNDKSADEQHHNQVTELEQVIGQLTVENTLLKKASRWLSAISQPNGKSH